LRQVRALTEQSTKLNKEVAEGRAKMNAEAKIADSTIKQCYDAAVEAEAESPQRGDQDEDVPPPANAVSVGASIGVQHRNEPFEDLDGLD
jgi:hypothetical protein